jgi:hypothetical protein
MSEGYVIGKFGGCGKLTVDVDEGDANPAGDSIINDAFTVFADYSADDHERNACANRTADEQRLTTNSINQEKRRDSGKSVHDTVHARS